MSAPRPRPRPRFELRSELDPQTIFNRVEAALPSEPELVGLLLPPDKIELTVADDVRRVWSPQLSVVVEPTDEGTTLHARFGPHPHVWTLYVALYAVMTIIALLCAAYGAAQWMAGNTPVALYLSPLALALAGLVFGASYVGQGLGSEQMYTLRAFLERAL